MAKAKVKEYVEIPLNKLTFNTGQMRTSNTGEGINELAMNIKANGLLQPILVSPSDKKDGMFEVLLGQRRVLAYKSPHLNKNSIMCGILSEKVSEIEAKVISISENAMRKDPSSPDYKDACLYLFEKYGTIKAVVEKTGVPRHIISKYVKREALPDVLKKAIDKKEITLQDAVSADQAIWEDDAKKKLELAKEFSKMNPEQKRTTKKIVQENPGIEIKASKKIARNQTTYPLRLNLLEDMNKALNSYASAQEMTLVEAAEEILEDGLSAAGININPNE